MSYPNQHPNPEFSLYMYKVPGIPVGRIYIPHVCANRHELLHLHQSIHVIDEYFYMNGDKLLWFVAPVELYHWLATQFPHRKYAADTEHLLTVASTFFMALKLLSTLSCADVRFSLLLLTIVLFCIPLPSKSQNLLINLSIICVILINQMCGFFFQLS